MIDDRLLNNISLSDEMLFGPSVSIDSVYLHSHFDLFKEYFPETYTIILWIKIEKILFKPQFVLNLSVTDVFLVLSILFA